MYTFVDRPLELPAKPAMGGIPGYIEAIGKLMLSGAIPKSQSNVESLKFLTDEIKELYPLFEKQDEKYLDRLLVLSYAIEDIQLGPEISLRPEAPASALPPYTQHGI